jgi:hypothetical protein
MLILQAFDTGSPTSEMSVFYFRLWTWTVAALTCAELYGSLEQPNKPTRLDRYQRKYHKNSKFGLLISKGFRFASQVRFYSSSCSFAYSLSRKYILALTCTTYPESKLKTFLIISTPLINLNRN